MHEAAQGEERYGIDRARRGDRDFEGIAVRLLEAAFGALRRLFAREPAAPRRGAAGAVDERAAQADEFVDDFNATVGAAATHADFERRRAAAATCVVRIPSDRLAARCGVRHLVIADEPDVAVGQSE
jgi:hypothetical protein